VAHAARWWEHGPAAEGEGEGVKHCARFWRRAVLQEKPGVGRHAGRRRGAAGRAARVHHGRNTWTGRIYHSDMNQKRRMERKGPFSASSAVTPMLFSRSGP